MVDRDLVLPRLHDWKRGGQTVPAQQHANAAKQRHAAESDDEVGQGRREDNLPATRGFQMALMNKPARGKRDGVHIVQPGQDGNAEQTPFAKLLLGSNATEEDQGVKPTENQRRPQPAGFS
jgi:hypothetical protein